MKTKLLMIMILICLVFAGCKEKNDVDLTRAEGDPQGEEQIVESSIRIKATITYQGLGLMDADEDGNFIKSVDMGEIVYIIGEIPPEKGNWRPVEIELNDSEKTTGFANAWFVIPESKPGVTIVDSKIFSDAKTTKMTKNKIPEMRIIAISNDPYENHYAKVNYSLDGYAKPECYLAVDTFSLNQDDVNAARLFMLAKAEKDNEMQIAFLEEAAKIGSPTFGNIIDSTYARVKNGESLKDVLNEDVSTERNDDELIDSEMMMEADPEAGMDEEM